MQAIQGTPAVSATRRISAPRFVRTNFISTKASAETKAVSAFSAGDAQLADQPDFFSGDDGGVNPLLAGSIGLALGLAFAGGFLLVAVRRGSRVPGTTATSSG